MAGPLGAEEARRIAEAALGVGGADGVEVLLLHEWGGLTRFAESSIHQSTAREQTEVRVRAVTGGRVGVASTNDPTPQGVEAAARDAREAAEIAAPDPLFPGLAPPAEVPEGGGFDEATPATTPATRAEAVAELVAQCGDGFHAAGAYETGALEVAVANTEGQLAHGVRTKAAMTTVVSGGDGGAGFAERTARAADEMDPAGIGRHAFEKARDSQSPADLDPGELEVVLEPAAVGTLVAFLSYLGFGGRAVAEGRSCLTGREGERVVSERISIWDDALSPETLGIPFDFEGTPKRRVDVIRDGVFAGPVHDRRSARRAGAETTAHALPPPATEGPLALNLFMGTGEATLERMVEATPRGLLVSRFHYSNVVHPREAVITGMTRDGTWLIRDGEVAHPVKNLRFTESLLEALGRVAEVGTDSHLASEFFFDASRVPPLRISSFRFTGRSDH